MERTYPIPVVAALIIEDGKILLEKRAPAGIEGLDNMWDLPGGKVECGETCEQAIVRELQEELGIVVQPTSMIPEVMTSTWIYADGPKHWVVVVYKCKILLSRPQTNEFLQWKSLLELWNSDGAGVLPADWKLIKNELFRGLRPILTPHSPCLPELGNREEDSGGTS